MIYAIFHFDLDLLKKKLSFLKFKWHLNRPFMSSSQSLFESESKCKILVKLVISYNFNMNENWYIPNKDFTQIHLEREAEVNLETALS